jgi:hypothetical protein
MTGREYSNKFCKILQNFVSQQMRRHCELLKMGLEAFNVEANAKGSGNIAFDQHTQLCRQPLSENTT